LHQLNCAFLTSILGDYLNDILICVFNIQNNLASYIELLPITGSDYLPQSLPAFITMPLV
jgi:hypothetical protein